jgi:hypothetical protein
MTTYLCCFATCFLVYHLSFKMTIAIKMEKCWENDYVFKIFTYKKDLAKIIVT